MGERFTTGKFGRANSKYIRILIVLCSCLTAGMLLLLVLAVRPSQAAGPWYVKPDGNDGNDCLSPGMACASIQAAVDKASAGDTILVASGVYTQPPPTVVFDLVSIDKNLTISGGWSDAFLNQIGTSVLNGQTMYRYGIRTSKWASVSIERLTIKNNLYQGIFVNSASLTLIGCSIEENTRGGISNNYQSTLTILNSTISKNKKYGIINGGNVVISNSTISGNKNLIGGYWDTLGGGIWNEEQGSVYANNCTIVDNWSRIYGGGIYNEPGGIVNLRNSILTRNTGFRSGMDCYGTITSTGYNLIGDTHGCTFIPATGDLTNIDADLGQLVGLPGVPAYHPLLSSSLSIDAGDPSGCTDNLGNPLDTDQRGATRVGRCDIGAYEYTLPGSDYAIYEYSGNNQRTPPNQAFHSPLDVVVLDEIGSPVDGITLTFSAPGGSPSGVFMESGTNSMTTFSNSGGIATSGIFIADSQAGGYSVMVTATGAMTTADFPLSNLGWYVASSGSDENDCQSVISPCATIQGALDKDGFLAGDTLMAASGVYTGTGEEAVLVQKDAYMRGGWNENFTEQGDNSIIDGQHTRRGMSVRNGYEHLNVEVENFTFQNGWSPVGAGGVYNYSGANLILNQVVISNNESVTGGVFNDYASLILKDSIISDNKSDGEGGGGIYSLDGFLNLVNSTIRDNQADASGGIYNWDGLLIIENSVLENNLARQYNGGISNWYGDLILINSTLSGNSASNSGGGVLNYEANASLANSVVTNNSTYRDGGGIWNTGTVTIKNSILAGNHTATGVEQDCDGTVNSLGYNLIGDTNGCDYTPSEGDLIEQDAGLGSLVGLPGKTRYHPLLLSSPAIDAGDPTGCTDFQGNPLETDQRGAARVGRCDIGAYEYTLPGAPAGIYAFSGSPQSTLPDRAFEAPLHALALDEIGSPIEGVTLTFSAPASGASGVFDDSGTFTTTAGTSYDGLAMVELAANSLTGGYTVTVEANDIVTPANFLLRNIGWYVSLEGDDGNDCLSPGAPCASIDGVTGKPEFGEGDTILVASGIYTGTGEQVATISEDARLFGGWNNDFTLQEGMSIVDGQAARRGIWIEDNTKISMERFSIQNGLATGSDGGGVYLDDFSSLELRESALISNTAGFGGGIYQEPASVLILDKSTIRANTASGGNGGGIFSLGEVDVDQCEVVRNQAVDGGGIYSMGKLDFRRSSIDRNQAISGGGIYAYWSAVKLSNIMVTGNTAYPYGGGIVADFSPLDLENILFSANQAYNGGALYNRWSNASISNGTFSANLASSTGGALYSEHGTSQLSNSLLWANIDPNAIQVYNDDFSTATFDYSLIQGGCPSGSTCEHLLVDDPLFIRPAAVGDDGVWSTSDDDYGDLRLASRSPAIDAGDNSLAPDASFDLDGEPRFFDVPNEVDTGNGTPPIIDLGAYETVRASTATTITSHLPNPSVVGQGVTVTFGVESVPPVMGTPTGMVTISDGAGSGCSATVAVGHCVITSTVTNTIMLSGFYAGDDDYNASFVSVPHQVGISASQTTILSISPDPAFVGNATVVEFQVVANPPSGVAPTGNVTISDGLGANCTATVAEGQCTLVFSSAGNRWLTASYDGDGNFHPSENSAGCQVYFGFFLPYIAK